MSRSRQMQTTNLGLRPSETASFGSSSSLTFFRRRLLAWFDRHKRSLPWRVDRDPYRIWVSEVMLQQTQVATVIRYFHPFLKAFPTLHHLARADEQDVLRLWEGLGYYRRARDLHRAARILVANFDGHLLDNPEVWRDLPGVGRYILGAVLSQAFDRRLPIVEANCKRVLCRLFGQSGDPANRPVSDWLWHTAEAILPRRRVGDFNQAMMELGALVCTPIAPRCAECPLASICVAHREGQQESLPAKRRAPAVEEVREVTVVVRRKGRVLLLRRPAKGRWANMWEFPRTPLAANETEAEAVGRILKDSLGIMAKIGPVVLTIRHSVTRFRITLVAFKAEYQSGEARMAYYEDVRWLAPDKLRDYPLSRPQRRLADELANPHRRAIPLLNA